jgi:GTP-binding protein Era
MGVMNKPNLQIIFLDTPGLLDPKYKFQQVMNTIIQSSISDADILLYLVEAKKPSPEIRIDIQEEVALIDKYNTQKKPVLLVLNKIDLLSKKYILPVMSIFAELYPFIKLIPVSALKNDGLEELTRELSAFIPLHPPFYDPETLTAQPERFFVSEFIREQIFLYFREEIPYATEVQIEEFIERPKGKDLIRAIIFVERNSQKGIIIGKNGEALKKIGFKSRKVIESFLDREVYLELRVKVSKDWRRRDDQIKQFGY